MSVDLTQSKLIRRFFFSLWFFEQLLLLLTHLPHVFVCIFSLVASLIILNVLSGLSLWEGGCLHFKEGDCVVIEDRQGKTYSCDRVHVVMSNTLFSVFLFGKRLCVIASDMLAHPGYRQLCYWIMSLKQKNADQKMIDQR